MFFKDRESAGKELVKALAHYQDSKNCLVIGLPRGGVVTAFMVAKALHLPLDILTPRKLRAPHNVELAIGAVTEDYVGYLNDDLIVTLGISEEYLKKEIEIKMKEAKERTKAFRKNKAPIDFKGKTVILVDDGLATGATMMAAIAEAKEKGAKKIVVAIPVSHPDSIELVRPQVDEVVCLFSSPLFYAVGQFYENFDQTEDAEVMKLLESG